MFQLTIKHINIIHPKAQNIPKLRFWLETLWQPCPIGEKAVWRSYGHCVAASEAQGCQMVYF
jgi:hypothetical protein